MRTLRTVALVVVVLVVACGVAASVGSAQTVARQTATVTANAPIYLGAAVSHTPLRVAAPGTVLKVLQQEDDWLQVEFNDPQWGPRVGWIHRSLVNVNPVEPQPMDLSVREATPAATASPSRPVPEPVRTAPANAPVSRPKDLKIRGYVTSVTSPTEFEIEDYRITRDEAFVLDLQNADPEIRFRLEDIRVGVELEIKGLWYADTGVLKAEAIKVDLEQFKKTDETAVLTRMPERREAIANGSPGLYFANGQRIRLTPQTQVVFALTKREKDLAKKARSKNDPNPAGSEAEFRPLSSLDEVTVGMLMTYEGRRDAADGAIVAERVAFQHNDLEDGEKKLWESLKVELKPFNASAGASGQLKIDRVGKFKTLPDSEVQAYVERIGRSVIPPHQRDLVGTDPTRIPFQFHVVIDKTFNAFATPNGIIVVHSGLFDVLQNEAQLAFILSHEVSHAVQEHGWRQSQHMKVRRGLLQVGAVFAAAYGQYDLANLASMFEAALRNGYSRALENQADRMALEGMLAAGYDLREAPNTWKALTKSMGDSSTNWFWSSHDNNATRRSYLMNELKNNYAGLDYASLTVAADSFESMVAKTKDASSTKRKITVKH